MEQRITNTPAEISDDSEITEPEEYIDDNTEDAVHEDDQSYYISTDDDHSAEAILSFTAYTILMLGIFGSLILGGYLILDGYNSNDGFGCKILFIGPIASLIVWAILIVLVNISNNIHQIKHELQNRRH